MDDVAEVNRKAQRIITEEMKRMGKGTVASPNDTTVEAYRGLEDLTVEF